MITISTQRGNPKSRRFYDTLKVDTTDYLNPTVCRGENFIPYILRHLGASEAVIRNPQAIEEISKHIADFLSKKNKRIPNDNEEITEEEIEEIIEEIKSSQNSYVDWSFTVDKENGSVELSKPIDNSDSASHQKASFIPGNTGDYIEKITTIYNYPQRNLVSENIIIINNDGITMNCISNYYDSTNNDSPKKQIHTVRDKTNPFIAYENNNGERRYVALDIGDINNLNSRGTRKVTGNPTPQPIIFRNKADISNYCRKHQNEIDEVLRSNNGMRKLAEKSGLISHER